MGRYHYHHPCRELPSERQTAGGAHEEGGGRQELGRRSLSGRWRGVHFITVVSPRSAGACACLWGRSALVLRDLHGCSRTIMRVGINRGSVHCPSVTSQLLDVGQVLEATPH